jgi:thymidine phosphorylase
MNLAPADDKIIRVERPLSIDVTGLMLSSVMAKKYSVNATHVLIDIPYGKGAKIEKLSEAKSIKEHFLTIGKLLGMEIVVTLTDGKQPIGNGIGPLLEAIDVMKVFNCTKDAPQDLRKKAIVLAGVLLEFIGHTTKGKGAAIAKEVLDSGAALKKMEEMIDAQGKKAFSPLSKHQKTFLAPKSGAVSEIKNKMITKISRLAGAPVTRRAGLYLHKKVGDHVKKGDKLFTVHSGSVEKRKQVMLFMKEEFPYVIGPRKKKKK